MSEKSYNLISILLPCTFFLILYGIKNEYVSKLLKLSPSHLVFLHLIKSAIALTTLFLGIYFIKTKQISGKNIAKPTSLIFIGIMLLALSFGPTITTYYMMHNLSVETFTAEHLTKMKEMVINKNRSIDDRKIFASMIYVDSGEKIKILNHDGSLDFYKPTNEDELKLNRIIETNQLHNNLRFITNNSLIYQVLILVIISGSFIWLVKTYPPNTFEFINENQS